jgi:hypothetical protein
VGKFTPHGHIYPHPTLLNTNFNKLAYNMKTTTKSPIDNKDQILSTNIKIFKFSSINNQ